MTSTEPIRPVRHSVDVAVDAPTAFRIFTEHIGDWWPPEHQIGSTPKSTSVMEPGVGGGVYEIGEEGQRCRWGTVIVWEPPTRLVVTWQITANWAPEPDRSRSSEYEVTFTPEGDLTHVAVEHRHIERHGDGGSGIAAAVDGAQGWPLVLAGYATFAAHPEASKTDRQR